MKARYLAAILMFLIAHAPAATFWQSGDGLMMSNGWVLLEYNLGTGNTAFLWNDSEKISAFYSGVGLDSGYVKGINFSNRTWAVVSSNEVSVTSHAAGLPVMTQYFTLDQTDSFLTRVTMTGTNVSAYWMGPVVVDTSGGVDIGITNDNRALFVPPDNDHFISYNSEGINGSDVGNEVAAFYDNISDHGLVVGSVTHDTWKTGIFWAGSDNKLNQMNVFGGQTWNSDVTTHGFVSGSTVASPVMYVGFGNDWRAVMEEFAVANTRMVPALTWTNGVPFGWNSWGVTNYQNHLTYAAAISVSDSIHTNLQAYGFTNHGTVYVNLDSYWDNLWNDAGGTQLQDFVAHCHANGQKAGVYFTPFVYWGTVAQATNASVPVGYPPNYSLYHYSDILLRTASGAPISDDGGYAIDPTHPGWRGCMDYYAYWFTKWGFDLVKLDFLTHGALEGVHHDPAVTTGIQAYNEGMQYVLGKFNGRVFISESIAPLFPYQYGDARRIACDANASLIANTAYTMNAVSFGWWINGLYPFNDPDIMTFDNGPDSNEIQSRVISGAVTGVFLNGSILTNAVSVATAQMALTNVDINAVARVGETFRPVDGAAGTGAANIFSRQDGRWWDIACFNYTAGTTNVTVNLAAAGLPARSFIATNLWNHVPSVVANTMNVSLSAKQAKLFRLALYGTPPSPEIASATFDASGEFIVSGSNGLPGWNCVLLATTNLSAPRSQWTALATNVFDSGGHFSFTSRGSHTSSMNFQTLKVP